MTRSPLPDEDDAIAVPMSEAARDHGREVVSSGSRFSVRLVAGLVVLILAVGIMLYPQSNTDQARSVEESVAEAIVPIMPQDNPPPAEDIPLVELEPPVFVTREVLDLREELPPTEPALQAEDDDTLLRQQFAQIGLLEPLTAIASGKFLLQRQVALVDGASRGFFLRKLLPLPPPARSFTADVSDGRLIVSAASYARYDSYVDAAMAINVDSIVRAFHLLRPLYEQAYGDLGLPPETFDNAVIRSLDRILATPNIQQPPELERHSVMYTYVDPRLETLPSLQKQLLRMGPDNLDRLKQWVGELRDKLLQPSG